MEDLGLTKKEFIQLRLKCIEPFIATASKAGIEQDTVIKHAENVWEYAIKPLKENQTELPEKPQSDAT